MPRLQGRGFKTHLVATSCLQSLTKRGFVDGDKVYVDKKVPRFHRFYDHDELGGDIWLQFSSSPISSYIVVVSLGVQYVL